MKVLHINFVDTVGGAAIAASRHNEAMNRAGLDSKLLVVRVKGQNNKNVESFYQSKFKTMLKMHLYSVMSSSFSSLFHAFGTFSYSLTSFNFHKHPLVKGADVIYLHWVNSGMLNVLGIEKILKLGKPVYWYMHDMYPFTGGCHYAMDCMRYTKECNNCPQLNRLKYLNITSRQLKSKIKHWSKYENFKVVTPSRWLSECVKESAVFNCHEVFICPNVIDTNLFKIINKQFAREALGIKSSKRLILFGVDSIKSDYKGWPYLCKALNNLSADEYMCVIFGTEKDSVYHQLNMEVHFLGYLHDAYSLVLAYNACHVFVTPSLADNYPNVLLESLSCGLPCVGFNIGGIPDLIQHNVTGYLAKAKDSQGLADGIERVFSKNYDEMSANCRKWAIEHGSYEKVLELHSELKYDNVVGAL